MEVAAKNFYLTFRLFLKSTSTLRIIVKKTDGPGTLYFIRFG